MFGLAGGASLLGGVMNGFKSAASKQASNALEGFQDGVENNKAFTKLQQLMDAANKFSEKSMKQQQELMKNC